MVLIIDFKVRLNSEGEPFNVLIVQGGIQLVKSKETGFFYATAKKASIPSTFDDKTCESLIGEKLDGTVERIECEPYEFTNEETGELVELDYRWVFIKRGETIEEVVHQGRLEVEPELV